MEVNVTRFFEIRLFLILFGFSVFAWAAHGEILTGVEVGAGYQSRNDVRIPGDTGTGFSLKDVQGSGPVPVVRGWGEWRFADKHGLRLTAAPVRVEGTGTLDEDVFFVDKTFEKGTPVKATYQFDTYRLTYRYRFHKSENWNWSWGGTLLLRDAKIALEQEGRHASKSNLGLVPLLHLSGLWQMTPEWRALMEMDGLAGGPGRAIDATVQSFYQTSDRWEFGGGYRTIEGGSDVDAVYTFAWFHVFTLSANYRFN
jgi:hypothetical protein